MSAHEYTRAELEAALLDLWSASARLRFDLASAPFAGVSQKIITGYLDKHLPAMRQAEPIVRKLKGLPDLGSEEQTS